MDNNHFSLFYELHTGRGEDAEPLVIDSLIGVFDGMGGAGGMLIEDKNGNNKTGAYLASRLVQKTVKEYYDQHKSELISVFEDYNKISCVIDNLTNGILTNLGKYEKHYQLSKKITIKSQMIKILPSTMAVAYVKENKDTVDVLCLWAGDSRCYILSPENGLQQLTKDDLKMKNDAMENILEDSPMSNFIHLPLSGDNTKPQFTIHGKIHRNIPKPCIVFTATDGCFGYVASPMSFEYLILSSIEAAKSSKQGVPLGDIIKENLKKLPTADDCSLSGMIFGNGLPQNGFFDSYHKRQIKLHEDYISKLENRNESREKEADDLSIKLGNYQENIKYYYDDKKNELLDIISKKLEEISHLANYKVPSLYEKIDCINSFMTESKNLNDEIKSRKDHHIMGGIRVIVNKALGGSYIGINNDSKEIEELKGAQKERESREFILSSCMKNGDDIWQSIMEIVNNDPKYSDRKCRGEIELIRKASSAIKEKEDEIKKIEKELSELKGTPSSAKTLWNFYKPKYECFINSVEQ